MLLSNREQPGALSDVVSNRGTAVSAVEDVTHGGDHRATLCSTGSEYRSAEPWHRYGGELCDLLRIYFDGRDVLNASPALTDKP